VAVHASRVAFATVVVLAGGDAVTGALRDPPELPDVDVQQLTRPGSLVALRGLQADAPELADPESGQDSRHGPDRYPEALGDLRAGHP